MNKRSSGYMRSLRAGIQSMPHITRFNHLIQTG